MGVLGRIFPDMRRRMFSSLGALSWLLRQLGRVGSWPRVTLRARSPLTSSVDSLWTARRLGDVARPQPPHRGLGKPCGFTTSGLATRLGRFPCGGALRAAVGSLGGVWFLGLHMRRGMFVALGGSGCVVVQARASPGLAGRRHFKPGLGCRSGLNTQARGLELSAQEMEID